MILGFFGFGVFQTPFVSRVVIPYVLYYSCNNGTIPLPFFDFFKLLFAMIISTYSMFSRNNKNDAQKVQKN
jgi:hypothetical protein